MGTRQTNKRGFNPTKKVSRLSLALRGPPSKNETPINPQGKQPPSLEECKPILGDRLGCGWGWASRRRPEVTWPLMESDHGTPPQSNTTVASTRTWNNVSMAEDPPESWPFRQPVGRGQSSSDNQMSGNLGSQGFSPEAPVAGYSSPKPRETTSTLLGRNPGVATNSTRKAVVVLTDLRHDPVYGKRLDNLHGDHWQVSGGKSILGSSGLSTDSPEAQWLPRESIAKSHGKKRENIRTIQQPGSKVLDLPSAVHSAKRSRRASDETGACPEVLQLAIPSPLTADAYEIGAGGVDNPMRDSCASLDSPVKSSNISPPGDAFGNTSASTHEGTQQSPILGRGFGRRGVRTLRAGGLSERNSSGRVSPPKQGPDSDAETEDGAAQQSSTSAPSSRNFRMGCGDSSPTPPCLRGSPSEHSDLESFGLLEALEGSRRNINLALDEISDAGTRRTLRSVMDTEFGKLSVAISRELTRRTIIAKGLPNRGPNGDGTTGKTANPKKPQKPCPQGHAPRRDEADTGGVALVLRPKCALLDCKTEFTKRVDPVRDGLRIEGMRITNGGDLMVTVPSVSDSEGLRANKSLTEVFDVNSASNSWPKLRLTNVDSCLPQDRVLQCLISQNSLEEQLGIRIEGKIRIRGRVGPRGTPTTSWILEAHPLVWKALRDRGRAYIETRKCRVREYFTVPRCFKCHGYGHISRHCTVGRLCGHCGDSGHPRSECTARTSVCVPCTRRGIKCSNEPERCVSYRTALKVASSKLSKDQSVEDSSA